MTWPSSELTELDEILIHAATRRAQVELQDSRQATLVSWEPKLMKVKMGNRHYRLNHDQFKRLIPPQEGET